MAVKAEHTCTKRSHRAVTIFQGASFSVPSGFQIRLLSWQSSMKANLLPNPFTTSAQTFAQSLANHFPITFQRDACLNNHQATFELRHWCIYQKSVMSIRFPPVILGPEVAAPILWAPGFFFWFFLLENPHAHKIPPFRGGGVGFFWKGGVEVPILFLWARGFSWGQKRYHKETV